MLLDSNPCFAEPRFPPITCPNPRRVCQEATLFLLMGTLGSV